MNNALKYYLIFAAVMCVISLILYGADKRKSRRDEWRVPEAVLLFFGLCGGAAGALIGMKAFHHKTRKWYFWLVNIMGLLANAAIVFLLMKQF